MAGYPADWVWCLRVDAIDGGRPSLLRSGEETREPGGAYQDEDVLPLGEPRRFVQIRQRPILLPHSKQSRPPGAQRESDPDLFSPCFAGPPRQPLAAIGATIVPPRETRPWKEYQRGWKLNRFFFEKWIGGLSAE